MQEPAQDRREQILDIALKQFAEYGYHRTKISDIVQEAGVAQGTFYWHFKSKKAIALEVIQRGESKLLGMIHQGYRQSPGTIQDAVQSSEKLFSNFFTFAETNQSFMQFLVKGAETESEVNDAIADTWIKLEQAFQENIKRAIDLGMLPEKDPSVQSSMVMSLLEGMLARWLFTQVPEHAHVKKKTASELAKDIVRFEFFGLLGI
jgi:AcrR family transcriptional regulator